jgi:methionyl-tRNA formyltransferase
MRRARRLLRKVARIGPLGALNGVRLRGWYRGDDTEAIDEICARHGVPFHLVPSVNSVQTEAHFRSAEADLGVSLGNSYIAARIFEIPKRGMINLHGEILPDYRGGQSVIWPIYEGHTETGFTIHQIDASIDGGAILYQRRVPIEFRPALRDTVRKSQPASSEIAAAVRMVCEDHERLAKDARPQGPGTSYTTPTFRQYLRMVRNNRRLYQFSRARAAEMDPEPSVRDSIRGTGDR